MYLGRPHDRAEYQDGKTPVSFHFVQHGHIQKYDEDRYSENQEYLLASQVKAPHWRCNME